MAAQLEKDINVPLVVSEYISYNQNNLFTLIFFVMQPLPTEVPTPPKAPPTAPQVSPQASPPNVPPTANPKPKTTLKALPTAPPPPYSNSQQELEL